MFLSLFQLRSKEVQKVALVAVPVVIGTLVVHQICKYFKVGKTRYCKNDKKEEKETSSHILKTSQEYTFTTVHDDIEVAL
jgi:hypothetical protein